MGPRVCPVYRYVTTSCGRFAAVPGRLRRSVRWGRLYPPRVGGDPVWPDGDPPELDLVYSLVQHQPMTAINVHEAKTHLSRLLLRVAGGEEIVIARAGKPVAKLVPVEAKPQRVIGQDDGLFEVPDDFDAPLPAEVLALFQS